MNFVDMVEVLWRGRIAILVSTLTLGILALGVSLVMTPEYVATATIKVRVQSNGSRSLAALAGQFGGLASLTGLSLSGSNGKRAVALATLKSREIIDGFISKNKLLPLLFSGRWDPKTHKWSVWFKSRVPNIQDGYKLFRRKIFSVIDDKSTDLVTASVEWKNPTQAAVWLKDIVRDANKKLRDRSIKRSETNIQYLLAQAQRMSIVPVRTSLYDMAALEYKKLMIAENREDSVFQVIDPAQVPLRPAKPRPLLLLAEGLGLGFVCGMLYVLFLNAFATRRRLRVEQQAHENLKKVGDLSDENRGDVHAESRVADDNAAG